MVPPPVAVGLHLCNFVLAEEGASRRVSIIGSFGTLRVAQFPATPPFYVFASLTDGMGPAELSLHVIRLDTMEQIYSRTNQVRFPNKNAVLNVYYPVRNCAFPERDGTSHLTRGWRVGCPAPRLRPFAGDRLMNDSTSNGDSLRPEDLQHSVSLEGQEGNSGGTEGISRDQLRLPEGTLPIPPRPEDVFIVLCLEGNEDTTTRPLPEGFPINRPRTCNA
jgi:hypothetical protein